VNKDVLSSLSVVILKEDQLGSIITQIDSITKSLEAINNKIESSKLLQKSLISKVF